MNMKKIMKTYNLTPREVLRYISASAALPLVNGCHATSRDFARSNAAGSAGSLGLARESKKPKFLIVLTATGGANIQDSFLAIPQSTSSNGQIVNTFPDAMVKSIAGTPFRAV